MHCVAHLAASLSASGTAPMEYCLEEETAPSKAYKYNNRNRFYMKYYNHKFVITFFGLSLIFCFYTS